MKTFSCGPVSLLVLSALLAGHTLRSQEVQGSDYYTVKEGRLHLVKGAEEVAVEKEIVLPDGSKLTTNGVLVLKNGQEKKLNPTQRLTADGYLIGTDGRLLRPEDHITIRKGKVMLVKNGQAQDLHGTTTLTDGTQVTADGMVQQPDGKRFRLLDGQMLRWEGGILASKDHVMLKDGKVLLQKDGALITLAPGRSIAMSDGTKVLGNGTIVSTSGATTTLKEGQRLDLQGAKVPRAR